MSLTDLDAMTAMQLAAAIADGDISASEAVQRSLDRLEETEASLNAFVVVDREGALAAARIIDQDRTRKQALGPLAGVPISVKDLIDVAGMPARYGSLTLKDAVAAADAPSVERLRRAGAVIIGKTSTSEFGYRGYTKSLVHGNTLNPHDLGRTPGGSSGGAVASVAAGVTPIALGTDGGGSIRSPAALTGLVGIKATQGRIPVWPASATPTLAHVGPIARTVADAECLLRIMAGADLRDPTSLYSPIPASLKMTDVARVRVAFSPTLGYARVDDDVAEAVANAVVRLTDLWPQIELVDHVCPDPAEILAAEFIGGCSARLGDLVDTAPDLIDPPLLAAILDFRASGADRYTRLLAERARHRERMRLFFERFDLLLTPTTPSVAWPLEHGVPPGHEQAKVWSYFTYPFNLSGQPAASIPCGRGRLGLPVGLQIVAPLLGEPALLAALQAAERVLGRFDAVPLEPRRLGGTRM